MVLYEDFYNFKQTTDNKNVENFSSFGFGIGIGIVWISVPVLVLVAIQWNWIVGSFRYRPKSNSKQI